MEKFALNLIEVLEEKRLINKELENIKNGFIKKLSNIEFEENHLKRKRMIIDLENIFIDYEYKLKKAYLKIGKILNEVEENYNN